MITKLFIDNKFINDHASATINTWLTMKNLFESDDRCMQMLKECCPNTLTEKLITQANFYGAGVAKIWKQYENFGFYLIKRISSS